MTRLPIARLASVIALLAISLPATAQTPGSGSVPLATRQGAPADDRLATRAGHEVNASIGSYTYKEPGETAISIHGPKFAGEYQGTLSIDERRHWFARANVRGVTGNAAYDGWCAPFLIRPNNASPNGYELGLGDYSPCSETGDSDWYVEARGLVGKDLMGRSWAWSPYSGLGFRHLSNGTTGIPGFRTQRYLYLPVGIAVRTMAGSGRALGFSLEYDRLLRGWNTTRDSLLGSGEIPATATAPAFTIESFTDVSFAQHRGAALRASVRYQVTRRWSLEPSYVYWNVADSPVSSETVTFTVNGVTAVEHFGAFEPRNVTHEFALKWAFHF